MPDLDTTVDGNKDSLVDGLIPVSGKHLPLDFKQAVVLLTRPYTAITEKQYHAICEKAGSANTDILLMNGHQVTFGNADMGYALMPLKHPI